MKFVRTTALATLLLSTSTAFAAEQGFYFGINIGQARYDFDPVHLPVAVLGGGVPTNAFNPFTTAPSLRTPVPAGWELPFPNTVVVRAAIDPMPAYWLPGKDDEATAWSAIAGYRPFDYAAVEVAYVDLGSLQEYQPSQTIFGGLFGTPIGIIPEVRSKLETTAPTISALGILPITESFELFLRGGWYFADQKVTHASPGLPTGRKTHGTDGLLFGAGAQFSFGDHWTVRLDFQRFDDVGENNGIGSADIDVMSLGVLFSL